MNLRNTLAVALLLVLLLSNFSKATQNSSCNLPDSIDIFILEEANHIWDAFGKDIWQGFDIDDISILLFQSSDQQWLLNHPNSPDDFRNTNYLNYSISIQCSDCEPLWNYTSATIWPLYGSWTTILPTHSAWKLFCEQRHIPGSIFTPDKLVLISLHERFHAFQMRWLEEDFKNLLKISTFNSPPESREEILLDISDQSEQAVLCIKEQQALFQAYVEKDALISQKDISEFLKFRNQRLMLMNEKEIETENFMELIEGTAQYIEFQLAEYLQNGYQSLDTINNHPEFQNYKNAADSPNLSINNAKNGILESSRVYTTGTLMCLLMDRYSKDKWQIELFKNYHDNKVNLSNLLANSI